MTLHLARVKFATIVSVYAPALTNPEETNNKFFGDLHVILNAVPDADKLNIPGDFNARVGRDTSTWEGVIGKHGVGKCNGSRLLPKIL